MCSQAPEPSSQSPSLDVMPREHASFFLRARISAQIMQKAIVAKIQADVAKALQLPDVREKLAGIGVDVVGSTPEQLAAAIKTDYDRYGAIIRKLGIKAD